MTSVPYAIKMQNPMISLRVGVNMNVNLQTSDDDLHGG